MGAHPCTCCGTIAASTSHYCPTCGHPMPADAPELEDRLAEPDDAKASAALVEPEPSETPPWGAQVLVAAGLVALLVSFVLVAIAAMPAR